MKLKIDIPRIRSINVVLLLASLAILATGCPTQEQSTTQLSEPTPTQREEPPLVLAKSVLEGVSVDLSQARYNRRTGSYSALITLTNNSSDSFAPPLYALIRNITSPTVSVTNGDGETPGGDDFFDVSALVSDGAFDPGETLSFQVVFDNATRERFEFDVTLVDSRVPDVRGFTQAKAEETLANAGFVIGSVTLEMNDTALYGLTISQNPVAGTGLGLGGTVDLVVSLGTSAASQLAEATHDFLDTGMAVEEAVDDLVDYFWLMVKEEGVDPALHTLDIALSLSVLTPSDIITYINRNADIGPRTIDPDEASKRGWIKRFEKDEGASRKTATSAYMRLHGKQVTVPIDTTVIYVNGVWSSADSANASTAILRESLLDEENIHVILKYNPTGRADEQMNIFGAFVCPLISSRFPIFKEKVKSLCSAGANGFIDLTEVLDQYTYLQLFALFGYQSAFEGPFTKSLRSAIQNEVDHQQRKVVLVPHSQGNFYTRDAVTGLDENVRESVAIVEVASPSLTMPQPSVRVDVCNDAVPYLSFRVNPFECHPYSSVCTEIFEVLDGPDGLFDVPEILCLDAHRFIKSYMHKDADSGVESSSRRDIVDHIINFSQSLTQPSGGYSSALAVTPLTLTVDGTHGQTYVTVTNSGTAPLAWNVNESCDWVAVAGGIRNLSSGQHATPDIFFDENTTTESRSCEVTFAIDGVDGNPQAVTLTQLGAVAPEGFSVAPIALSENGYSGQAYVTISNDGSIPLTWTVNETCDWVTVSGGIRNLESGQHATPDIFFEANTSSSSRSCEITFSVVGMSAFPFHVTLTQSGQGDSGESFLLPGNVPLTMRTIPAGSFTMGSANGRGNEQPKHSVTISNDFQLGVTEVTKAQWEALMGSAPWTGQDFVHNDPDTPAVYISWNDAQEFIAALNTYTGESFRLPTEAEWEYACRAGSLTVYHFGDSEANLGDYAWWRGNAFDAGERYGHPVAQKLPNDFGLYDMHGNVWEWCSDWFDENYYMTSPDTDPLGPASSSAGRVQRGGAWSDDPFGCRSAGRNGGQPSGATGNIGFRVSLGEIPVIDKVSPWPTINHDARHSGQTPYSGPDESPTLSWSLDLGLNQTPTIRNPIIGSDGGIYVFHAGSLHATSAGGEFLWSYGPVHGIAPALVPGLPDRLYVAQGIDSRNILQCINQFGDDGWSVDLGSGSHYLNVISTPIAFDSNLVAVVANQKLWVFSADGTLMQTMEAPPINEQVMVVNGVPSVSDEGGFYTPGYLPLQGGALWATISAFDHLGNHLWSKAPVPRSGTVQYWSLDTSGSAYAGNWGFSGAFGGSFYCIPANGQGGWESGQITNRSFPSTIGSEYVLSRSFGYLSKISSDGTTTAWKTLLSDNVNTHPGTYHGSAIIDGAGHVYITEKTELLCLDVNTGAILWQVTTGDVTGCTPTIDANGTLYVVNNEGLLLAYE